MNPLCFSKSVANSGSGANGPLAPEALIQESFDKGHFKPYEADLEKARGRWDSSRNWLATLKGHAQGGNEKRDTLTGCYLFAIAVHPDLKPEVKERMISEHLNKYSTEKERQNELFSFYSVAVMWAHILRFSSDEMWDECTKSINHFRNIDAVEECRSAWVNQVNRSHMPHEEKQAFFDRLFDRLPQADGDELFYYHYLHSSKDELQEFMGCCSERLKSRLRGLMDEVSAFYEKALAKTTPSWLPFQNEYRRQAHVAWLFDNVRDHASSDLVACDLGEKDWEWARVPARAANLIEVATRWMTSISKRLSEGTIPDDRVSAFFRQASKYLTKEKKVPLPEFFKNLAHIFTPKMLFKLFDAFTVEHRDQFIKCLIDQQKEKIVQWLHLIVEGPSSSYETGASSIVELIQLIDRHKGLEELIPLIFDPSTSQLFQLTCFAALEKEQRRMCLAHLMLNREAGLKMLSGWICTCVHNERALKPFVKGAFTDKFIDMLNQIDANCATDLKRMAESDVNYSNAGLEFIDTLLPVGEDLNDPIWRQKHALRKLKKSFQTSGISFRDREDFVRTLYKDLQGVQSEAGLVRRLFHELPSEHYPLIFLHFDHVFHPMPEMFKDKLPPKEPVFAERHEQIAHYTQALLQVYDNPSLQCKQDDEHQMIWCLQHLYECASANGIASEVIQRSIEATTPDRFIPTMNLLARACFPSKSEDFKKLVSECLNKAQDIEKPGFIADCLAAQESSGKRTRSSYGSDLESCLWSDPFVKTDQERASLARRLIHTMDFQFLSFFMKYRSTNEEMIRSLYSSDPAFTEEVFCKHLGYLCQAINSDGIKFLIFQNMCFTYARAGVDPIPFLKKEANAEQVVQVKRWYSQEIVSEYQEFHLPSLQLLQFLAPDLVPTLFSAKIDQVLSEKHMVAYSLYQILQPMQALPYDIMKLLDEKPKVKEVFASDPIEALRTLFHPELFPLIEKYAPDYLPKAIQWTKEKITAAKERALHHGSDPSYYDIKCLLENLAKLQKLDLFIKAFNESSTPELKQALETITKSL